MSRFCPRLSRFVLALLLASALPACDDGGGEATGGLFVPPPPPPPPGPGSLVAGFGSNGVLLIDPPGTEAEALGLAIDANDMYVVGSENPGGNKRWRIEKRRLSTGALDAVFGAGTGVVISDPGPRADVAHAIVIDGASMYVVGTDEVPGTGDQRWRIEKRSLVTGNPVAAFGGTGAVTSDPTTGGDTAVAVAMDAGSIYVAGWEDSGDTRWRVEKRNRTTGALDATFGGGTGAVTSDPSSGNDMGRSIAIDANWLYVAGTRCGVELSWRVEKRSLVSGNLDVMFGAPNGFVESNPSAFGDEAYAVAINATSMFVSGYETAPAGDPCWRIERRSLATGSLEHVFGGSGVVQSNPTPRDDRPWANLVLDGGELYVSGNDEGPGTFDWQWRVEKRLAAGGSPVASFGGAGAVTADGGPGDERIWAAAADATALYLVGTQTSGAEVHIRIEKRRR